MVPETNEAVIRKTQLFARLTEGEMRMLCVRGGMREHPVSGRKHRHLSDVEVTQSERDWAFAKRALARGDDPEEVIRRIADYRGDQKHSGYARYTVEKAQREIGGQLTASSDIVRGMAEIDTNSNTFNKLR